MARFITIDSENIVVGIRFADEIAEGEIESGIGELGQIMNDDGTFSNPIVDESILLQPTVEEKLLAETQYQTMLLEMSILGGN